MTRFFNIPLEKIGTNAILKSTLNSHLLGTYWLIYDWVCIFGISNSTFLLINTTFNIKMSLYQKRQYYWDFSVEIHVYSMNSRWISISIKAWYPVVFIGIFVADKVQVCENITFSKFFLSVPIELLPVSQLFWWTEYMKIEVINQTDILTLPNAYNKQFWTVRATRGQVIILRCLAPVQSRGGYQVLWNLNAVILGNQEKVSLLKIEINIYYSFRDSAYFHSGSGIMVRSLKNKTI